MPVELALEQRVVAQKVFASVEPRRFLISFKVLDNVPRTNSMLMNKLWETYPEVAGILSPWSRSGDGKKLGKICQRSLSTLGLAEFSYVDVITSRGNSFEARAWTATGLVAELSALVHFVMEGAHRLGVSTHLLFSYSSGNGVFEAPLNKALIISELATRSGYVAGKPVLVGQLEERVRISSYQIYDHLAQLEIAGLVNLQPLLQANGKTFYYGWCSQEHPSASLPEKQALVASYLYDAVSRDRTALVSAAEFCPSFFNHPSRARAVLRRLMAQGLVQEVSKYKFNFVIPTEQCILAATTIVDRVLEAIADQSYNGQISGGAESFMRNEGSRLAAMATRYVAASKTI